MTKEEFQIGFFEFLEVTADKLEKVSEMPCLQMRGELRKMSAHLRRQVAMAAAKREDERYGERPA